MALAVAIGLLVAALATAAPLSAAPQNTPNNPIAKKNAAAAKRLQRQRDHLERQRERIKRNRQRFTEHKKRVRERLKQEREEAQAQTGSSGSANGDVHEGEEDTGEQGDDGDEGSDVWSGFFPWATDGGVSDNLLTGLGLAGLGVAGALILIFGLLGSYLPSMGGKAEYDALQVEIKNLTKRRNKQIAARERFVRDGTDPGRERRDEAARLTDDLSGVIRSKEEEARHKYRQVLWLGIPIYVLVGGGLAVLLASNALQALLIGFAWTSIAERLGLRREQSEKEPIKENEIGVLAEEAKEAVEAKAKLALEEERNGKLQAMLSELSGALARKARKR